MTGEESKKQLQSIVTALAIHAGQLIIYIDKDGNIRKIETTSVIFKD